MYIYRIFPAKKVPVSLTINLCQFLVQQHNGHSNHSINRQLGSAENSIYKLQLIAAPKIVRASIIIPFQNTVVFPRIVIEIIIKFGYTYLMRSALPHLHPFHEHVTTSIIYLKCSLRKLFEGHCCFAPLTEHACECNSRQTR